MEVNVTIFGQLIDIIGKKMITLHNVPDTDALKNILKEQYPGVSKLPFLVAVDKEVVSVNTLLHPSAAIALLPPYAGG